VDIFLLPITIEAVIKAMDESLSQNDLDALFGDLQVETKKLQDAKEDGSLSQNDLDALFGDLQVETKKPQEITGDGSLSQNDLDALFGDLQVETKKPKEIKEVKNIESMEDNEVLSQDQIDELLKSFLSG
jgi:hypothetical protein